MKNCIDKSENYDWKKTAIEIEKVYQLLKKIKFNLRESDQNNLI